MDRDRWVIRMTGALVVAGGVALGVVRFFGEVPPGQNLEAAVGAVAFGAVIAAPGVLALLAPRGRPALLLPAACILVPLSFLSFALVTLPLLIPAMLLFGAYSRLAPVTSTVRALATTVVVVVLLVGALLALFARDDPREYVTYTTSYGVGDVITYSEAAVSVALTTTALLAGWWLAAPRRHRARSKVGAG